MSPTLKAAFEKYCLKEVTKKLSGDDPQAIIDASAAWSALWDQYMRFYGSCTARTLDAWIDRQLEAKRTLSQG